MTRLKLPTAAILAVTLAACGEQDAVTQPEAAASLAEAQADNGYQNAADDAAHLYRVTVENLTTGQPLSPGVIVTHTKQAIVWQAGSPASEGIRLIAENGEPSTAVSDLDGAPGMFQVKAFPDPLGPIHRIGGPGETSGSIEIAASANADHLSLAIMLICTNDGFTGLSSVKLPGGFQPAVYETDGYDAGTEVNEETSESIVDPCGAVGPVTLPADGNAHTPEGGVIMHHPGIAGIADLDPSAHGWENPVARITIQRIR